MNRFLRSLVDNFDVAISSEKIIAKLDKCDDYHAAEIVKSMHVMVEHVQGARDAGILVRRMC